MKAECKNRKSVLRVWVCEQNSRIVATVREENWSCDCDYSKDNVFKCTQGDKLLSCSVPEAARRDRWQAKAKRARNFFPEGACNTCGHWSMRFLIPGFLMKSPSDDKGAYLGRMRHMGLHIDRITVPAWSTYISILCANSLGVRSFELFPGKCARLFFYVHLNNL